MSRFVKVDGHRRARPGRLSILYFSGSVGVVGNLLTLVVLCSSASIRNKTFNMFLISQSLLDLICAAILIATAWDVVWASTGSDFGVRGSCSPQGDKQSSSRAF